MKHGCSRSYTESLGQRRNTQTNGSFKDSVRSNSGFLLLLWRMLHSSSISGSAPNSWCLSTCKIKVFALVSAAAWTVYHQNSVGPLQKRLSALSLESQNKETLNIKTALKTIRSSQLQVKSAGFCLSSRSASFVQSGTFAQSSKHTRELLLWGNQSTHILLSSVKRQHGSELVHKAAKGQAEESGSACERK